MTRTHLFVVSALILVGAAAAQRFSRPAPFAAPLAAPSGDPVQADGPLRLSASLSSSQLLSPGAAFLRVEVAAPPSREEAAPVNLAVVIDRSGSMAGEKLTQAKAAADALVGLLRRGDRFTLVQYDDEAQVLASVSVDADSQEQLHQQIAQIEVRGGTNIGAGLATAARELLQHAEAYRSHRLVLLSDGMATTGMTTPQALEALAAQQRQNLITISAFGIGSDFDEVLLEGLARSGGGDFAYIENMANTGRALAEELERARHLAARDLDLALELAPGLELVEAYGSPVDTVAGEQRIHLYDLSAGHRARLLLHLRVQRGEASSQPLVRARISYRLPGERTQFGNVAQASAAVTASADLAMAGQDAEVMSQAAKAASGILFKKASERIASGDQVSALQALAGGMDGLRRMFGNSADSLGGSVSTSYSSAAEANTPEALARAQRALHAKGLAGFADDNNATY